MGVGFAALNLVLLVVVLGLLAPNFFTPLALSNILSFAALTGLVVVGVSLLMIAGEFDLSVGSTLAVGGFSFAILLNAGVPSWPAFVLALLFCAGLGFINGTVVVFSGIPSFIATLGTMLAYRGVVRVLGGGDFAKYTGSPPLLFSLLNGPLAFLNNQFNPPANFRTVILWFLLLTVVAAVMLHRTRFGNWIFATGGHIEAARAQGVPVRMVKLVCFTLTGLLAGLAGVAQFSAGASIDPLRGEGLELIAVVSCVIGGVLLTGGAGSVVGAVVGILLLQTLEQGLVLLGISVQVFRAIVGFILVLSVILTTAIGRRD
jgi:simple sugar transport system permease protein